MQVIYLVKENYNSIGSTEEIKHVGKQYHALHGETRRTSNSYFKPI